MVHGLVLREGNSGGEEGRPAQKGGEDGDLLKTILSAGPVTQESPGGKAKTTGDWPRPNLGNGEKRKRCFSSAARRKKRIRREDEEGALAE